MKENEISSNNEEVETFLVNNSNVEKEKEKERDKLPSKLTLSVDEDNIKNINNEMNLNDDDSDSLLKNNSNNMEQNTIFDLRLYLYPRNCCQSLKMTKMGKSMAFFYDKNENPLIIIGPQWPYCLILLFIATITFIFIYLYYNNKSSTFVKISDWIFFGIWLISYTLMCIKNPGYPKMCSESIRGTKEMSYCDKCEVWYKPSNTTVHCEICDICIEGYTHHCLWAGHCIGINNKKDFYIFLAVSIIFPVYLMVNIAIVGKH